MALLGSCIFPYALALCGMSFCRSTAKRPLTGIFIETLHRDLAKRPCRDLVQRPGQESSDLAERSCLESSNRDLPLRSLTGIFCGDLLKTPCTDSLTQGSCAAASLESLDRDLPLRSLTGIFCGDLLKTPCTDKLT